MWNGRHIVGALYGAWRLAHGDARGMTFFTFDSAGFWSSFLAAGIVLPLHLLALWSLPDADGSGSLAAELLFYAVRWIDFPILAIFLTRFLGLSRGYVPMIVVTNWASVWQSLLMSPVQILGGLGLLGGLSDILTFAVLAAALVYQWYVTRLTLQTTTWTAIAFVLIDLLMGIGLAVLTQGLH